jgi:hypothetical protein
MKLIEQPQKSHILFFMIKIFFINFIKKILFKSLEININVNLFIFHKYLSLCITQCINLSTKTKININHFSLFYLIFMIHSYLKS